MIKKCEICDVWADEEEMQHICTRENEWFFCRDCVLFGMMGEFLADRQEEEDDDEEEEEP